MEAANSAARRGREKKPQERREGELVDHADSLHPLKVEHSLHPAPQKNPAEKKRKTEREERISF